MSFNDDLNWRYACKRMNGEIIPQKDVEFILNSINMAPTSMGMQLFKVFVIKDRVLMDKIQKDAAPRQLMILGASHLLVFAAYKTLSKQEVDAYLTRLGDARNIKGDHLDQYKNKWYPLLEMADDAVSAWAIKQTYITMAYATMAAATVKVDCTPVEGADFDIIDQILDLDTQNLQSTLLLPLGYRDAKEDHLAREPKVRKANDEIFVCI